MFIDEALLGPLRDEFGGDRGELLLLPERPSLHEFWKARRIVDRIPKAAWRHTWDEFAGDLPEPEDYGEVGRGRLEVVVLLAFLCHVPVLAEGIPWMGMEHQGGGLANRCPAFIARRLAVRPSIYPALRSIARDRWPNDPGDRIEVDDGPTVAAYRRDLARLGLRCDHTTHALMESVYPIDATDEALDIVCADRVRPADLIVGYDPDREKRNLAIVILTTNSD